MSKRIQKWFTKIVIGLESQGWKQSVNSDGVCLYRGPNNRKCAIGHVINNRAPVLKSNLSIASLKWRRELNDFGLGKLTGKELSFLEEAQMCHDNHSDPANIKSAFSMLAEAFKLLWPSEVSKPQPLNPT